MGNLFLTVFLLGAYSFLQMHRHCRAFVNLSFRRVPSCEERLTERNIAVLRPLVRISAHRSRSSGSRGINITRDPKSTPKHFFSDKREGGRPDGRDGVRINKCLTSLSRRGADDAIDEGRVTVNGKPAQPGQRVFSGDKVELDGRLQRWERLAKAKQMEPSTSLEKRQFVYIKYWKPKGVTSTSDTRDASNIISAGGFDLFPQRLFTVGRLDKDSTGLILLTSDGRVNNALLSPATKKEKSYEVTLDKLPTEEDIEKLENGVVIQTTVQRDNRANRDINVKTLPCVVKRIGSNNSKRLQFTLTEGRNRQIRKMCSVLGYTVVDLHRTMFCGISLKGISEGNWKELTANEMIIVQKAIKASAIIPLSSSKPNIEDID